MSAGWTLREFVANYGGIAPVAGALIGFVSVVGVAVYTVRKARQAPADLAALSDFADLLEQKKHPHAEFVRARFEQQLRKAYPKPKALFPFDAASTVQIVVAVVQVVGLARALMLRDRANALMSGVFLIWAVYALIFLERIYPVWTRSYLTQRNAAAQVARAAVAELDQRWPSDFFNTADSKMNGLIRFADSLGPGYSEAPLELRQRLADAVAKMKAFMAVSRGLTARALEVIDSNLAALDESRFRRTWRAVVVMLKPWTFRRAIDFNQKPYVSIRSHADFLVLIGETEDALLELSEWRPDPHPPLPGLES